MTTPDKDIQYKPRWYFGGIASAAAVVFTHPLDLIKVLFQTHTEGAKPSIISVAKQVVADNGVQGLYFGLSASILRQLTYSMARFAIYEGGKEYINTDNLVGKVSLAAIGGGIGGFIGVPTDVVNVRMQNDVKLPPDKRRNYKHVIDGLSRVYHGEGIRGLLAGASTASGRGLFMTVGQLAFYDQTKIMLLKSSYFNDNVGTHVVSSVTAGAISTLITQPLDVIKTRVMNAKPGEFNGLLDIVMHTAKAGPLGFFKGLIPAFVRIGPQTVLIFVFYEQLRLNFGIASPK